MRRSFSGYLLVGPNASAHFQLTSTNRTVSWPFLRAAGRSHPVLGQSALIRAQTLLGR